MSDPRNWDKELAEIDKLMASDKAASAAGSGVPAPVSRSAAPAPGAAAPRPAGGSVTTRPRDTIGIWLRALLGLLGVAALAYWPYNKACGTSLYLYLAGVVAVLGMALYTMRYSWTHRRGVAHIAGMLVLLGGLALAAAEILPRTGYAAAALSWTCP